MNRSMHHSRLIKKTRQLFIFLFLLSSTLHLNVQAQTVLTPDDVAKIKSVSGVDISPNGSHVAYTLSVPADPFEENSPARNQLYLLDTESGDVVPFLRPEALGVLLFVPDTIRLPFLLSAMAIQCGHFMKCL